MADTAAVVKADEIEKDEDGFTELVDAEIPRVDLVDAAANGTSFLIAKSAAAPSLFDAEQVRELAKAEDGEQQVDDEGADEPEDAAKAARKLVKRILKGKLEPFDVAKAVGGHDETGDIAGALATITQIANLIASEAGELAKGRLEEIGDIQLLVDAACALKCFLASEKQQAGVETDEGDGIDGALPVMYAALEKSEDDGEAWPDGTLMKFVSADQRKQYASSGVAMPNGDFPIADKGHLKSAVGHYGNYKGDKAAAKKHIIRRAKKLGLTSLLPDDWEPGGGKKTAKAAMLTEKQAHNEPVSPDMVNEALAKAAAAEERATALAAQLAEVSKKLDQPMPGGPYLVPPRPTPVKQAPVSKAQHYRALAARTTDVEMRRNYLALAAETETEVATD